MQCLSDKNSGGHFLPRYDPRLGGVDLGMGILLTLPLEVEAGDPQIRAQFCHTLFVRLYSHVSPPNSVLEPGRAIHELRITRVSILRCAPRLRYQQ
jgi:hypothetical protein